MVGKSSATKQTATKEKSSTKNSTQADLAQKNKSSATKAIKTKTRIHIQYDVGFGNRLTIRGHGVPSLSWDKGFELKNLKENEWVFETEATFTIGEFKVLINDQVYERGPNHAIKCGNTIQYTPSF